ncbi:MAG: preprotein translocase subunit SecG [Clostridiales bacterium]|nr:preprotein translocase subunit SecG [Clostridiales bacterium]
MNALWYTYVILCSICLILIFITAFLSIIVVLFQKSNSEGIQGITASSETFFGKHKGNSLEAKLKKWTWICLAVIAVLAIAVYVVQIIFPSIIG